MVVVYSREYKSVSSKALEVKINLLLMLSVSAKTPRKSCVSP